MGDIFITADTHFGHKNIIKHARRPFESVKEMDECLVDHWNAKIRKGDTVYHIGDFAWGDEAIYGRFKTYLNGNIFLVKGNHDYSSVLKKLDGVFTDVRDMYKLKHDNEMIVMCHYPMYHWDRSHFNSYHVHGHSHGMLRPSYDKTGKILDVGVDTNNFYPYHVDEVVEIMRAKPNNKNYLTKDAAQSRK